MFQPYEINMDHSNKKWAFHIVARLTRTCRGKTFIQININNKWSFESAETTCKINQSQGPKLIMEEPDLDQCIKTHYVYAATIDAGRIYTDQTGRFPVVSRKGNTYIMILYDYDRNAIMAQPIKDRTAPELLRAFQVMEQKLVARGLKPKLMKLDKEGSKLLKTYLHQQDIIFQLVPPYSHRRNAAERAIRSFKDHLITGLCSTDKSFPMHLWDILLPQSVITLNMLRTPRINPKLSASTHIDGKYDYNRSPVAPPGTIIIAHETPSRRRTWAPHGQDGWYIGLALEHYRCYTVYVNITRGERIVKTVEFFPEEFKLPFLSTQELATKSAKELTHSLLHPQPAGPFCQVGDEQTLALKCLAAIFEGATRSRKSKVLIPPAETVGNDAPPRVQITVSPPRVQNTATPQRVAHQTTTTILMPNSHRRTHTTPIRAVTPPTPHAMVRRSAVQQHSLSQDMIAETVHKANRCFSFPTSPRAKTNEKTIKNEQVTIMPEMANAVICPETGNSLKHQEIITHLRYKIKRMRSTANDINRLYKTNTIRFIRRSNIPKGRKVTYGSFVVDIKEHKEEQERTRLMVGGDQIEYPGNKSTRTAGLTTAKILINSVISTLGAKFLVIDTKKIYLSTPLGRFEYMVINLSSLPQETIDKYNLMEMAQDGKVYIEIHKGMYGLPQAGILANELLQRNLAKDGYRPTQHTHGLWKHDTRPISFSLVVDDFGVKYVGREHAEHLMACIKKNYEISSDWKGSAYCGLTLEWDYNNRTVDLSMPG
jgi:hypothetical protein